MLYYINYPDYNNDWHYSWLLSLCSLFFLTGSLFLQVYSRVAGPTRRLATEIAQSVEALGDKFRQAMRWLKYIQTAYAAGPASAAASSTV